VKPVRHRGRRGRGKPLDLRTYVRYRHSHGVEVDVTVTKPLDDRMRQFLDAVQRCANRVVRFSGDGGSIRVTVLTEGRARGRDKRLLAPGPA
jgi:hypothetical protein